MQFVETYSGVILNITEIAYIYAEWEKESKNPLALSFIKTKQGQVLSFLDTFHTFTLKDGKKKILCEDLLNKWHSYAIKYMLNSLDLVIKLDVLQDESCKLFIEEYENQNK